MTRSIPVEASATAATARFATRYQLHERLGEGGMATVQRATDRVLGREVALKQLRLDAKAPEHAHMAALFEREFHTLAQLSHPHVIGVFDYGLSDADTPYYTMELLDGGDLRERAPLPWQEACQLMFGVCSALALLHSRRLLHRDVTPRNVRCTQSGVVKLIDFGTLSPMSSGGSTVMGTPGFTAPETLQRLALDARTDLYSLGVTLYYALTARLPYAARTFSDLVEAWKHKPSPASASVPEIPGALDDLILSLISVDPGLRPASAYEVMQRLAACAGLQVEESEAVSRAYLSTPSLVGRDAALVTLRDALRGARLGRAVGVVIQAAAGCGRSRLLEACALEALTRGYSVARATANRAREPFAVARSLVGHILDAQPNAAALAAVPELFSSSGAANDGTLRPCLRPLAELEAGRAQRLLHRFIVGVSRLQPLVIAVDDVHRIDEPSAALLAELIDSARPGILVLLTADAEATHDLALRALTRRCHALQLWPLTREQTGLLLASVFGDVANLERLRDALQGVALGNPRQTLELAQQLVDRRLIRYSSGSWILPGKLAEDDLPRSASAAMQARAMRLSAAARALGEAQALAFHEELSDDDYRSLLFGASSREVELARLELLEAGAVLRDGAMYRLANRAWSAAFLAGLDEQRTRQRHRALATMYAGKLRTGCVYHTFAGGLFEEGLAQLELRNEAPLSEAEVLQLAERDAGRIMGCYPIAIETARRLGRSPKELHELRRWQYLGSVTTTAPADRESARIWFEQLSHDAGLDLYRADTQSATREARLMNALQRAQERYLATPERERVYPVDQALRKLGEYVLLGVVEGARSLNSELLHSLPDILEPYTSLSPLLEAIWLNMSGAREAHCHCNFERARELWQQTLQKVESLGATQEGFVGPMRNAVVFALGTVEAQLGLASAAQQAERLDSDAFQRISGLTLRKLVRLEQGDAAGAERLRRQAEVLALQQRLPQMFQSSLAFEVFVYARCNDLAGLTQTIEQLAPLAASHAGWRPVLLHAEGSFQLVRGDHEAARAKFEAGLALERAGEPRIYTWTWMALHVGVAECLLALGQAEQARAVAGRALSECEARGASVSAFELVHVLALAGDPLGPERLDALIARQNALGTTGLRMGLSYEVRARLAIASGDAAGFELFSERTAHEYRHGARTALAARYERLMNEAARAGMQAKLTLAQFQALGDEQLLTLVTRSMAGHHKLEERAQVALQMICAAHSARAGHLFLLTPAGPVLGASQGEAPPAAELEALAQRVCDYASEQEAQAAALDDMATDAVADESPVPDPESRRHELLPLRNVIDAASVLLGVVAIEHAPGGPPSAAHAQLLHLLAQSLAEVPGPTRVL